MHPVVWQQFENPIMQPICEKRHCAAANEQDVNMRAMNKNVFIKKVRKGRIGFGDRNSRSEGDRQVLRMRAWRGRGWVYTCAHLHNEAHEKAPID